MGAITSMHDEKTNNLAARLESLVCDSFSPTFTSSEAEEVDALVEELRRRRTNEETSMEEPTQSDKGINSIPTTAYVVIVYSDGTKTGYEIEVVGNVQVDLTPLTGDGSLCEADIRVKGIFSRCEVDTPAEGIFSSGANPER